MLLQKNLIKFQAQIDSAVQQRSDLNAEFKQQTGTNFNKAANKYDNLPAELAEPKKDPEGHIEAMREAYVQDSRKLMECVVTRA